MKLIQRLLSFFGPPKVEPKKAESGVMRLSPDGIKLLRHYEGLELVAYYDVVGRLTIGYGDTENVTPGMRITEADAEVRLRNRLSRDFEPGVMAALTARPSQHQFDACVSLSYNVGVSAFTKSTLARNLNAGDVQGAADQFQRWVNAGGKSLKGLRRRRAAERSLFLGDPIDKALRIGNSHG